ncbi:hypothetical protein Sjap_018536 [Stephania japonica]|uniref:RING-type domain-containing protein n=1 Tax=Stephania japonica TaxID=461633 RepID=A0AAP0I8Y6_9MAGN
MWTSTTSSSSSRVYHEFYSRRLLLQPPLYGWPSKTAGEAASPSSTSHSNDSYTGQGSIDSNIVMILSVLLCALICALGLNSIIRCALRCSSRVAMQSNNGGLNNRLANKGIKRKALKTFPTVTYSAGMKMPGLDTECIICLSDFAPGERLRFLPKCNHGFHVRCIDKWLMSHSSCPTCRQCLIDTCEKIVSGGESSSTTETMPPLQGVVILPLEPEGLIRNYRGIC